MFEQLANLRQIAQPIILNIDGAGSTTSLGVIFLPSPQIGALQSASTNFHYFFSQLGH
jgi:hypothetical protein